MKPVTRWISDADLRKVYTSRYWNNIAAEKKKEWWIADGDYDRCLGYLTSTGLLQQHLQAEWFVDELALAKERPLIVADLAAGIGWTSASLSKLTSVEEIRSVEISQHRLDELFEHAVRMLGGRESKISRYLGSFYDLQFEDESIDLIFMSQAFHHADKPFHLLHECDRVLRPGGRIIVTGEHLISIMNIAKTFLSNLVRKRRVVTNFFESYPPDSVFGDHYYRISDYYFMFNSLGYVLKHHVAGPSNVIYVADKASPW